MVHCISRHGVCKHPVLLAYLGRAALLLMSTSRLAVSASSLTLSRWYLQQHNNKHSATTTITACAVLDATAMHVPGVLHSWVGAGSCIMLHGRLVTVQDTGNTHMLTGH